MTTQRPVIVAYYRDAAPDELHPQGVPAGTRLESPSPVLARQFHPQGHIVQYADGGVYEHRAALAEERKLRAADVELEAVPAPEKPAPKTSTTRAASTSSRKSKSSSRRSTSAKPKPVKEPTIVEVPIVAPEPVQALAEPVTPDVTG